MSFYKMVQILQKKNKGKIILCELGYFYIAIGKDAIFLNKLIGLKLNCIKPEICKIGFPINSLEKYEKLIKEKECSYMVFNFDHTKEELKIIRNYNGKYNNEIQFDNVGCLGCKNNTMPKDKEDKYMHAVYKLYKLKGFGNSNE